MNLKSLFTSKQQPQTVVVGAESGQSLTPTGMPKSRAFLWVASVLLLGAMCLSVFFTGSLLADREVQTQQYYQLLEEKKTEQQNLEALQLLMTQLETIETDQALFERVLPVDQHYEHLVSLVESLAEDIRQEFFVTLPELISWRPVSQSEVTNGDLQDLGVYEYQFAFFGEYQALMNLFELLRSQQRLIDVRSVRNLKRDESGMVSADLTIWSYHLYP